MVESVERNSSDSLRITGFGHAFEGTGLLTIDDADPVIVSLGSSEPDWFSVIVPWDGTDSVRVRLETGRGFDGEVPDVVSFVTTPEASATTISVFGVADDDVLNVRSSAGVGSEILATLPPDTTGIVHLGDVELIGDETWWEIAGPANGWVNRAFLAVHLKQSDSGDESMLTIGHVAMEAFGGGTAAPSTPLGVSFGGSNPGVDQWPTPFTSADSFWSDEIYDWYADRALPDGPCGEEDACSGTVAEFLAIRGGDVDNIEFLLGTPGEFTDDSSYYWYDPLEDSFYQRYATVVAYVPATQDGGLDWSRYTFAFNFIDGSPTIRAVWVSRWSP